MIDVEVPEHGTVVVQQGEPHDVHERPIEWVQCWCSDRKHTPSQRSAGLRLNRPDQPHLIAIQKFELTWEVK